MTQSKQKQTCRFLKVCPTSSLLPLKPLLLILHPSRARNGKNIQRMTRSLVPCPEHMLLHSQVIPDRQWGSFKFCNSAVAWLTV